MVEAGAGKARLVNLNGLEFVLSPIVDDCTVLTDSALDQLEQQLLEQATDPESNVSKRIEEARLKAADSLPKPFRIVTPQLGSEGK